MSAKTVLLLCVFALHLGPVTPQTTPEPFCVYNNVRHEVGSTFQTDTCTEGYCGPDGDIAEGPNCCEYNNKIYDLNSEFFPDPCTYGYCESYGEVSIAMAGCMQCIKYNIVPGQCCPECVPACEFNGEVYDEGPVPTGDPCQVCECPSGGGNVQCYGQPCVPCHNYEDYIWVEGQCCPQCRARPTPTPEYPEDDNYEPRYEPTPPGSRPDYDNNEPSDERTPPPSRPEYEYYGPSAERTPPPSRPEYEYYGPSAERTPPPSSPANYYYEPKYEPIPESPPPSRAACYHEGRPYPEGPVPSNDRCVECECPYGGGDVQCYSGYCPRCSDSAETVSVPGECCPVCRERPTPTPSRPEDDYYVPTSEPPTPPSRPEDDNYVTTSEP